MQKNSQHASRMRKRVGAVLGISTFLILAGTSRANIMPCQVHREVVSWYGRAEFERTASGRVLNHNAFFAASRTLPFGTKLVVENPRTGSMVVVTVLDRGPYVRGRSLDLSYGAARALGMIRAGVITADVMSYDCWLEKRLHPILWAGLHLKFSPAITTQLTFHFANNKQICSVNNSIDFAKLMKG